MPAPDTVVLINLVMVSQFVTPTHMSKLPILREENKDSLGSWKIIWRKRNENWYNRGDGPGS